MSNYALVRIKKSHKIHDSDEFFVIEISENGLIDEAFVSLKEFGRQDFFNNRLKD